jgi:xylulokinase
MAHYLGLDSSTQSLSAMVVDSEAGKVVLDTSVNFGKDLPEYGSPSGFLPNADANIKHANPLMWVAALDLLLSRIKASGFSFADVRAVSGAGQQHGSVYLARRISEAPAWDASRPLADQVAPLLSRQTAPIWMDSSTSAECLEIAEAVGGHATVTALSGSRAIERFTGPQIRRFCKTAPSEYEATREIHLVSSFMASLLTGTSAAIDLGDGAGMNLLELRTGSWSQKLLDATAPGLGNRLPAPKSSKTVVGEIAGYFVEKYGFAKGTPVVAFSGDNPSSLIGMGASKPGVAVVSLGTSDTVFAAMSKPLTDPRGYGHVFGNPAGGFMSLICFTNGSLAREEIAKRFHLSWDAFARAILEETKPGNNGSFLLPYFVPETTPKLLDPEVRYFGSDGFRSGTAPEVAARAIVESQAISMRIHSDWIGEKPETLLITGGASRNKGILQVLADVFQAELRTLSVGNSSALGGALRAAEAAGAANFGELAARFSAPDPGLIVKPDPGTRGAYEELQGRFGEKLNELLSSNGQA